MKTLFKMKGTLVTLKTYNYHIPVYPGMSVLLNQKYYTVQHAVLNLEKDEVLVVVERSTAEPV